MAALTNGSAQHETSRLIPDPPVCAEALDIRQALELAVALDYDEADIVVEIVSKAALQEPASELPLWA